MRRLVGSPTSAPPRRPWPSLPGAVYRGVYRSDLVAVKLLNGGGSLALMDQRALARDMATFHAEMSILSRLRHRNIVRLYGGCMRPPHIFLVMQLMAHSLDAVIHNAQRPLTLRRALQLARDVAAGLSYLHPTIGEQPA
jgi:serine/threonine protein kinase